MRVGCYILVSELARCAISLCACCSVIVDTVIHEFGPGLRSVTSTGRLVFLERW